MRMRRLLLPLRRLFSNQPNVIQTADGVCPLAANALHKHWIVGRGLCMYRCEQFANVPRNRRRAALELNLPLWSPFPRTGHHCVWADDTAMVWFWDASQVRQRAAEEDGEEVADFFAGADAGDQIRVYPETVFHPKKADGFHLQICQHGFEMQYWSEGALSGSFWLPERPDQQRIDWFLASVGEAARPADVAAAAVPAAFATEPWATPETPQEWLLRNERRLTVTALATCLVVAAWQEARIWRLEWSAAAAAEESAQRNEELGPTLATRDEVRRLRRRNVDMARILNIPSQAQLMGLVHETLPDATAQFQEWSYSQGDLSVVLKGPDIDSVAYVQGLERAFDQVNLSQAQKPEHIEIGLKARL